jgi:hypothetical protein
MISADRKVKENGKKPAEQVKKMIMCKGNLFGEENLLKEIIKMESGDGKASSVQLGDKNIQYGKSRGEPDQIQNRQFSFLVQSACLDGIVISAPVEEIAKLIKNDGRVINYLKKQMKMKYPDQELTDTLFANIIRKNKKEIRKSSIDHSQKGKEHGNE